MHRVGYIAIDRSHGRQALKSLDRAAQRIAAGSSGTYFPPKEPEARMDISKSFKAGAVLLAIKAGVPIVPLGFNGSYEVLPKGETPAASR